VTIEGKDVTGETRKGSKFKTYIPDDPEFVQSLSGIR